MRLPFRLLLPVFVALIPAAGIQIYSEFRLQQAYERELKDQVASLAGFVSSEHQRVVDGIHHLLSTLVEVPSVTDGGDCQPLLSQLKDRYPSYVNIFVTDALGRIRCSTNISVLGLSVADRDYWRQALHSGRFTAGGFILGKRSGRSALPFAMPYHDGGVKAGTIAAVLDISWLSDLIARRPLPPNIDLLLADRDGIVLVRVPEDGGLSGSRLPERFMRLLRSGRPGTARVEGLTGRERLVGYIPPAQGAAISSCPLDWTGWPAAPCSGLASLPLFSC